MCRWTGVSSQDHRLAILRGQFWIDEPSRVFIARNGRHELTNLMPTSAQVEELVERMLKSSAPIALGRPHLPDRGGG